jgi:FO synthase
MAARGVQLERLMHLASSLRDRGLADAGRPHVITYSRKVFIPLTRLCRDRCHYCTFVAAPGDVPAPFLSPEEVLQIADDGAVHECKEALFTLGDRPEDRWPQAREWLESAGYASTLDYVRAMAILVLEHTGLLPHLNPGVMSWSEMLRLRAVAPSMGMMLETTSTRLWSKPGGPHFGSPDKDPAVRLRVIEDAGRLSIPFTTGVLVGIGETLLERAETLLAIRSAHRAFGHVQEVIVQNFRAKPHTPMATSSDTDHTDFVATVAAARVLLGPGMRLQVPPNLSEPEQLPALLAAGLDDWGGVSPVTKDHVNPERPWPHLADLATVTAGHGMQLRERLTIHPSYVRRGEPWLDPRLTPFVGAVADANGLAREGVRPAGQPWQEPERLADRAAASTGDEPEQRFGDWATISSAAEVAADGRARSPRAAGVVRRLDGDVREALRRAEVAPQVLLEPQHETAALALLSADGAELDAICSLADEVRRSVVGDTVTYVVNRNINFTNVCYTGCRFCAFAQRRTDTDAYELSIDEIVTRADQAWNLGATEVCLQGGIDPQLAASHYSDIVRAIRSQCPDLHIHAFSPMEIATGAARAGVPIAELLAELKDAGLGSLPGTAAEILDDEVRWVLTKGKLPASTWVEVIESAHSIGLRTSSTMMFGHVDRPDHWLSHLRVLAGVQDRTAGFTEFVPLPFIHTSAPLYLAGIGRPGPSPREVRAVHAASRLMLHGRIDHVQVSWVKLGGDNVKAMLGSGVDDLGGTLMEETISRMAGSQYGSAVTVDQLRQWAAEVGRPTRQRTTLY